MKTLQQAYYEASNGLNIAENEQIVLAGKNTKWCFYFALNIPEANIKAHEEIVIVSKDPHICFCFAKHIKGTNKQLLSKVVLESLNEKYIKLFYNNIDFDKTKYESYFRNLIFK